ncbi:hypothetical protein Pmar_PMAR014780 [Perkinsus marinus ATCC 50983]|uniref:Uncharacterized protein n=1 Tax=Perkinsus marinus (strain ATCC 50983 / TXsc) TaxID=423536 RepID=C5LJZ1_PERM5|nr:hypothetical protein Pmar_PMAR014780 [Perkinsus marinus ATCC 50983]EER02951.1 hypothetical protein Pmar_PMAR014780 [Perkinsus marinus ATCC 50983]|eukprot:XP_002771135.1 hypothetical protein Pmar_PMAR014780 [Perkinsus marinus ATCC 50983]
MKKDGTEKELKRCAENMLSAFGDGILTVFSDGSKADGRVVPLSPYGSIYYAELADVFMLYGGY